MKEQQDTDADFSLRWCQPDQVQRDCLNSFQNTPKAGSKVGFYSMVVKIPYPRRMPYNYKGLLYKRAFVLTVEGQ